MIAMYLFSVHGFMGCRGGVASPGNYLGSEMGSSPVGGGAWGSHCCWTLCSGLISVCVYMCMRVYMCMCMYVCVCVPLSDGLWHEV